MLWIVGDSCFDGAMDKRISTFLGISKPLFYGWVLVSVITKKLEHIDSQH